MSNNTLNMTEGKPSVLITKFALPIFISHVFQQLYTTADSFIVGKFLDTDSLAAVTSSGNLIFLMISFFTGVAMGGGVAISKYFGAQDEKHLSESIHTSFFLALISGIVLSLIGVLLTPNILVWMKTDKDILPQATDYFSVYFAGSIFVVIYNMCTGIMNAVGNSKTPLYYLALSSILNIVLDIIFIAVFKQGVWSAAFATVISQAVSSILCIIHLVKDKSPCGLNFKKLKPNMTIMKEIVSYGLPSGIQNSVIGFANVIVQTNINAFGKIATAGFGSYAKIEGFAFLPITSFSMALSTFTGQNLGAGKKSRARKGAIFGIAADVVLAEIIGILFFIFAPTLISLFTDDARVIEYGVTEARLEALFYCLLAFSHSIAAICRGAGKAFVPMLVMLSVWCLFRIIYITVVVKLTGDIRLIYTAYPLTWFISSIIYFLYYKFSHWENGFDSK